MKRTVNFSAIVIVGILLITSNTFALSERSKIHLEDGVEYVSDVLVVAVSPGYLPLKVSFENGIIRTGKASLDNLNARFSVSGFQPMFPGALQKGEAELAGYYRIAFSSDFDLRDVLEAYDSLPETDHVEPVGIHRLDYDPNDPQINQQWAINKIQARGAWDVIAGRYGGFSRHSRYRCGLGSSRPGRRHMAQRSRGQRDYRF